MIINKDNIRIGLNFALSEINDTCMNLADDIAAGNGHYDSNMDEKNLAILMDIRVMIKEMFNKLNNVR